MAPSSAQSVFAKDERVLCFHHELLYEAKVLEAKLTDPNDRKSASQYKIHYKGWKNTWDDWVPQDRLRKFTDENKELAANLRRDMDALRRPTPKAPAAVTASHKRKPAGSDFSSARGSEERNSSVQASAQPRGQKRARDFETERQEESYSVRPTVRLILPDALKALLVDDWENITKNLMLVPIPARVSVNTILDAYYTESKGKYCAGSAEADILEEVVQGTREYFDKCLGRILLYRFERDQYYEARKLLDLGLNGWGGKGPADLYGAEHLCRLFVAMPELIAQTNMDHQAVTRLRQELADMALWLHVNMRKYFAEGYENASQNYIEQAKGQ
ncbi:MAG: Esa1p-associated factor [Trizodia sp. TS-e1964]|nr:MAG: Esa1p-associated factor [Trizodia sp. TS-e1964]